MKDLLILIEALKKLSKNSKIQKKFNIIEIEMEMKGQPNLPL